MIAQSTVGPQSTKVVIFKDYQLIIHFPGARRALPCDVRVLARHAVVKVDGDERENLVGSPGQDPRPSATHLRILRLRSSVELWEPGKVKGRF